MTLRKCPACRDTVGAESEECPRCGVNFRAAMIRKAVMWSSVVLIASVAITHFALHLF
jgi:hypothetical protein